MVINPYKRYPIYTERTCQMYINKRRNEVILMIQILDRIQQRNPRCLHISLLPVTARTSR